MRRREFLSTAIAAGLGAATLPLAVPRGRTPDTGTTFAIFDPRYPDARAFAAAAARLGAIALPTGLDPVRLWEETLRALARPRRTRLIGLTPSSDLVVLRSCAAGRKLTLLYEGLHDRRGRGSPAHEVVRPRGAGVAGCAPRPGDRDWAETLARALVRGEVPEVFRQAAAAPHWPDVSRGRPGTLVSWLIG